MTDKVVKSEASDLDPRSHESPRAVEEEMKKTSIKREWEIKKLQQKYGLPREAAERLVDESRGKG